MRIGGSPKPLRPTPVMGSLPRSAGWGSTRMAALVVLGIYCCLFLRWSLADEIGPAVCCHVADQVRGGLSKGICWRIPLPPYGGECAVDELPYPGSPLLEPLQAAWYGAAGVDTTLPLLPTFLFFVASLLAFYFMAEKLAGGAAGLLVMLIAMTTELFALRPLAGGGYEGPACALSYAAFAITLHSRPSRSAWLPLAAGCVMALAVLARWLDLMFLPPLLLLLAWRARRSWSRSGGARATGVVSLLALVGPTLVTTAASRHLGFFADMVGYFHRQQLATTLKAHQGWELLVRKTVADLEWSALWPPSLLPWGGRSATAAAVVLLVLAAASVPAALAWPRGRMERLAPLALAVIIYLPLGAVFTAGPHNTMVLGGLVVACGVLPGLLFARLPRAVVLAGLAALAGLVCWSLASQWTQEKGSIIFSRLVGRRPPQPKPPTCAGGRCREFTQALRSLQVKLLQAGRQPRWVQRGFCTVGVPEEFPYDRLARGIRCGEPMTSHRFWTHSMLQVAWSEPWRLNPVKDRNRWPLAYSFCPLDRSLSRPPRDRCRWLIAFDRAQGSAGPGVGSDRARVDEALVRWDRALPGTRRLQVVSRRIGSRRRLRVWRRVERLGGQ